MYGKLGVSLHDSVGYMSKNYSTKFSPFSSHLTFPLSVLESKQHIFDLIFVQESSQVTQQIDGLKVSDTMKHKFNYPLL
jgi:hypothetical protein